MLRANSIRPGLRANHRHPRIGIYVPGAGAGGPWRYAHSLLAGVDPAEFQVTIFCDLPGAYQGRPSTQVVRLCDGAVTSSNGNCGVSPLAARAGVERRADDLPGSRALRLWSGFGATARRLAKLVRESRLDLFHTQNTGCEESPVAARLAGVPRIIGTFHVDPSYDLHGTRNSPRYRVLEHISNHCLTAGIGVSGRTSEDWIRRTHLPRRRVVTIHNGIDPRRFRRRTERGAARAALGLPADALVIGAVGRLDEAKGLGFLISAVALLAAVYPKLVLVLAGEGPLRESLTRQAESLGIAERVRFLGFQQDVQPVLDGLDVFALPSLCETLGYAHLEAMATCLPAIGTTVGGVPEVIVDGQTGLLVPPRDATALAAGLRWLLESAELRQRMGAAGRDRIKKHFTEREMVSKTIDLYRRLLNTAGNARRPACREGI